MKKLFITEGQSKWQYIFSLRNILGEKTSLNINPALKKNLFASAFY